MEAKVAATEAATEAAMVAAEEALGEMAEGMAALEAMATTATLVEAGMGSAE